MKNVVLIGFMGCGKSTVGIRLSYRLRRPVEDTDKRIEREQGVTISEIFAQQGEEYFRNLETELLERMCQEDASRILATGGGLPLREENRQLLRRLGHVVYLRVRPETVYQRLRGDSTRPLLQGEDPLGRIKGLLGTRQPIYEATADTIIDVDDLTVEEIICRIENIVTEG